VTETYFPNFEIAFPDHKAGVFKLGMYKYRLEASRGQKLEWIDIGGKNTVSIAEALEVYAPRDGMKHVVALFCQAVPHQYTSLAGIGCRI